MHIDTLSLALAQQRLCERIAAGLNSGPSRPLTGERVSQLKVQSLGNRR